jgi:DNA polymerase I-like protein with 3'-5' exonuclease and polymerase domains
MNLTILTGDFESYYDSEYSLSRMTPVEYICDPRFEIFGMSVRVDEVSLPMPRIGHNGGPRDWSEKARWVEGRKLHALFAKIDWKRTAFMSHNVGFDGAILKWRYGITPALYIDTLGMCRAAMPDAKGASLDKALAHIGAPPKGTALAQARGMRLAQIKANAAYYDSYTRYANRDCDGCFWLFEQLAHGFAGTAGVGKIHRDEEFLLMDMVARMTIHPQMRLNPTLLANYLSKVQTDKAKLLARLKESGILDPDNPKGDLMSNEKFANILRNLGIDPPTKVSFKTGKTTYAFSKTDQDFTALLDDEDPLVQALVAARLGYKSTLEETRTERFIKIAGVDWPILSEIDTNAMPFPLKFSGAHTHRLSGDWSLNLQNLGRKSELRRALEAPPGYLIVSADASQIEARVVSWLAGATKLLTAFRNKLDAYALLASSVYGYAVDKRIHIGERFVGKTAVLGLGFGMGAPKFVITCWNQGRAQGLPPEMCRITDELGQRTVRTYRTDNHQIPTYWKTMDNVIGALSTRASMQVGVLYVDGPDQSIILPNGMRLFYRNMRREVVRGFDNKEKNQWLFDYGRETKYTFGGKMTENVVQALAKIITMNAATRIRRISKHTPLAGQIHDQLVYVVPKSEAHAMRDLVVSEMRRTLDWFHDLPLDAEGEVGPNLLEAK